MIAFSAGTFVIFSSPLVYGSFGHHKHSSGDSRQKHSQSLPSIAICCGWGNKIAGVPLTYSIFGGDPSSRQAVVDAMNEWASKIDGLQLRQSLNTKDSEISIGFQTQSDRASVHSNGIGSIIGKGHFLSEILGETKITPKGGLINKAQIILARTGFGSPLDTSQIRQIAVHEIGHALGLGHANFVGDIMAPAVNYQVDSISKCDINAVLIANNWKLGDSSNSDQPTHSNRIACN